MISFKPEERPTIDEILNHPWMKGSFPSDKEILEEFKKRDEIVKKELELEELIYETNEENDSNLFRKEKGDIYYFIQILNQKFSKKILITI